MKQITLYKTSRLLLILLSTLLLLNQTQAMPILGITTTHKSLSTPLRSTTHTTYIITNNSGMALSQLHFYPPTMTQIDPVGTNCNTTLAPNSLCMVRLIIEPIAIPGSMRLNPLTLCAFNGNLCSTAAQDQQIQLTVGGNFTNNIYVTYMGSSKIDTINAANHTITNTATVAIYPVNVSST